MTDKKTDDSKVVSILPHIHGRLDAAIRQARADSRQKSLETEKKKTPAERLYDRHITYKLCPQKGCEVCRLHIVAEAAEYLLTGKGPRSPKAALMLLQECLRRAGREV